ncbi:MAG: hypothetical protein LDL33_12125, partial [Desulfomonile sp.]|nr:hypothetical protein [Desulfomonile sp.]
MGHRDYDGGPADSRQRAPEDAHRAFRDAKERCWIHQASFLFRRDEPEKIIETVWIAHPGWGYLKRRDLWIPVQCDVNELLARGFLERRPASDGEVGFCPHCGMYMSGIPGYLVQKHTAQCGGPGEDWLKMEEEMISERRIAYYEKLIMERIEQEKAEQEA